MPEILVLGGGYAGLTAAARLGEADIGCGITLVDAKPEFVERIRLHEIVGGKKEQSLPYAEFLAERGVAFVQASATGLDPERRRVEATAADGTALSLGYDVLVYALGSATEVAAVPGAAEHAWTLDSVVAAHALNRRLREGRGARVLVVGGGLTGIEAAAELAERIPDLSVTLAAGGGLVARNAPGGISADGVAHLRSTFERLGVAVHEEGHVVALRAGSAQLAGGREIPFDICLWTSGFRPAGLARRAGIAVNPLGQIVTDAALRSISHPAILAVGDAAQAMSEAAGPCRMSCAAGRPMGAAAAATAAALLDGAAPPSFGFSYTFRCISLGREDGLIQFVDETDRPLDSVWTGARAARWKEYICRRTLAGIGFDQGLGPVPDTPPARPARVRSPIS